MERLGQRSQEADPVATPITYPDYPDEGLWAIRLASGEFLHNPHGNLPTLFQYKYRAHARVRYIKGARIVPVELKELS
jgi:hypothetical protein